MPTLSITKSYDDGTVLTEAQLDDIKTSIETFVNTTKLDSDNIQDGGISSDALASSAVSTAKIASGAVTQVKRAALGQQVSSSSSAFSTTSTSYTDVTNLSVSITTTGRPVMLQLIPDSASTFSYLGAGTSSSGSGTLFLKFLRDSTDLGIHEYLVPVNTNALIPVSCITYLDVPASGTYTYKLQVKKTGTGNTAEVAYAKLIAYEL